MVQSTLQQKCENKHRQTIPEADKQKLQKLKTAGYDTDITYSPQQTDTRAKKTRRRNIIWFNPPFSKNVKTNIGRQFLKLISKNFSKSSKLHKFSTGTR